MILEVGILIAFRIFATTRTYCCNCLSFRTYWKLFREIPIILLCFVCQVRAGKHETLSRNFVFCLEDCMYGGKASRFKLINSKTLAMDAPRYFTTELIENRNSAPLSTMFHILLTYIVTCMSV
jgi:hypothetical protein